MLGKRSKNSARSGFSGTGIFDFSIKIDDKLSLMRALTVLKIVDDEY